MRNHLNFMIILIKCCIILSALLGNGCIPVIIVGSLATGVVLYDNRNLNVMQNDIKIFYQITHAITTDPRFTNARIIVASFNQNVLLIGQTQAATLKIIAEKIAYQNPLVLRVYNEISINKPITMQQKAQDTWITSHVRSQMLVKSELRSGAIKITTENGVVYLMGQVTLIQANLAVDVARRINGVRRVIKVLQIA